MHNILNNLTLVKNKVNEIVEKKQLKTNPKIIVVTKTFAIDKFKPLLEHGHTDFGENKIQEAENKWPDVKNQYKNLKLHMVGKLQSNKAKKAVMLFDYIHSLDNEKLANKLNQCVKELKKNTKFFIQINVGDESQKSGIQLKDLKNFFSFCTTELSLNIVGLMCLPPNDLDPNKFFSILKENADILNLNHLSMGMTSDYEDAVLHGSTYLRLGTAILGKRTST